MTTTMLNEEPPLNLNGKIALVTGSSRGIGRAIALGLAKHGADVAINYHQDEAAATEVKKIIESLGRRAIVIQSDVTEPEAANRMLAAARKELGRLNILVNNVGDFLFKPIGKTTQGEWRKVIDSNLNSVFYLCKATLPDMREQRFGRIINIGLSPNYMVRGAPNVAAYSISKTGVIIFSRSLAIEEARHGITINCVSPGLIDNGYLPDEQREWMERRVPMGRLGRPEEVADAVVFLASQQASYISGANLAVSGAWDWQDRPTEHDGMVHDLFVSNDIDGEHGKE